MRLMDTLKQEGRKVALGVALSGVLLGAGCSKENTEEVKDKGPKMEQRTENKSEIRQKIAYLDEYVAAVESGKSKEQAYHEFALKMADGNTKKMEEMEKQAKVMQGQIKDLQRNSVSIFSVIALCMAFGITKDTINSMLKRRIKDSERK